MLSMILSLDPWQPLKINQLASYSQGYHPIYVILSTVAIFGSLITAIACLILMATNWNNPSKLAENKDNFMHKMKIVLLVSMASFIVSTVVTISSNIAGVSTTATPISESGGGHGGGSR